MNFLRETQMYGKPIACSNNGKVVIFRKDNAYLRLMVTAVKAKVAKDMSMTPE